MQKINRIKIRIIFGSYFLNHFIYSAMKNLTKIFIIFKIVNLLSKHLFFVNIYFISIIQNDIFLDILPYMHSLKVPCMI